MKKIFNKKKNKDNITTELVLIDKKNWKNIHQSFTYELQESWESKKFDEEQTRKWIRASLLPSDADFAGYLKSQGESPESYSSYDNNTKKELRKDYEKELRKDKSSVRNILLIGRTGNGKSTLANVLVNKNGNFEEVFKEGEFSESKTKAVQSAEFEHKGIRYKVVDTVGINDTNCSQDKVLEELAKACWYVKEEINQVLFITGGRFTKEEKLAYELLGEVIFNKDVSKYTAIIRTGFDNFEDPKKCQEDQKILIKNNEEIADLIDSNIKIIHVNNPPLNITSGSTAAQLNELNKKIRKESRKILLEYLEKCNGVYKSENFYRKFCAELEMLIKERNITIEDLERTREKLSKRIKAGKYIENISTVSQVASGLVSPFIPYVAPVFASAEIVDRIYKLNQLGYEQKRLREFKRRIEDDKKAQEECLLLESMLVKQEADDPEFTVTLLEQMDNKIKEFNKELQEMIKAKGDHEKKFESWNERRKELRKKIEKSHNPEDISISQGSSRKEDWISIHDDLRDEIIKNTWANQFTWAEAKDWFSAIPSLNPLQDLDFLLWIRDIIELTPEEVVNSGDYEQLREQYQEYQDKGGLLSSTLSESEEDFYDALMNQKEAEEVWASEFLIAPKGNN